MLEHEDAFGHIIQDYFNHGVGPEIVEREDGYIDSGLGGELYFQSYEKWSSIEREAIDLAVGRVLDVGCGAGRHALHLQQQGHQVVGIDVSPLAIEVCKKRGLRDARVMPVTKVSKSLGTFGTIIMLGNNFGLMGSYKRARWLLRKFRRITEPGAQIIAQTIDPYETDNRFHLAYHEMNRQRGRMGGQVRLRVRYRTYITPWFDYLFVTQDEMKEILSGTGWVVDRFLQSDPPGYIAVIKRS